MVMVLDIMGCTGMQEGGLVLGNSAVFCFSLILVSQPRKRKLSYFSPFDKTNNMLRPTVTLISPSLPPCHHLCGDHFLHFSSHQFNLLFPLPFFPCSACLTRYFTNT